MESANSLPSITPSPPTSDVPLGIGTTKFALLAPNIGSSMLIKSVSPFLTNAKLTTKLEFVSHATKDMTSFRELVSSPHSTTPSPPTQDAVNGTGTTRFASNAQADGSSTLIKFASLSLIFVLLMMPQEPASHASRDMISSTEFVSSLHSTMPNPPTSDAHPGTGTIRSA